MSIKKQTRVLPTSVVFGSGGAAVGALNAMPAYFVLLYYSQVLGAPATLIGLALAVSIVFDAISDPIVGIISDNWKSKFGRRHPFLYVSIIPMALLYYFLWSPPAFITGGLALTVYVVIVLMLLKIATTLFDVPGCALLPELTTDYDQRTKFMAYRMAALFSVPSLLSIVMYAVWLQPTELYPDGVLNPQGYQTAGVYGALLIFLSAAVFSFGLHSEIPNLKPPPQVKRLKVKEYAGQVVAVLSSRSIRVLLISAVFNGTARAMFMALWVYIYSFFWELNPTQISVLIVAQLVGGFLPALFLPRLSRGREKKHVAVVASVALALTTALPIILRLFEVMPANGTSVLFNILFAHALIETALWAIAATMTATLISDVVEQTEAEVGYRSEGIIFSMNSLVLKSSTAFGTLGAGVILDLTSFPRESAPDGIPSTALSTALYDLGIIYGPAIMILSLISIYFLNRYEITREKFSSILEKIDLNRQPPV